MAEAAGDAVVVAMPQGAAEAKRMGQGEAGLSRWWIRYPWGAETYYGTADQVVEHMKTRGAEHRPSSAPQT